MRYSSLHLPITLLALLLPAVANSASSEWMKSGDSRFRLVIADPKPGETRVDGALEIDLAPGWKTYWKDPGDAGVPPDISIDGSVNAHDLTLAFPHPKRFDDGVTVWAGYDQPVRIPFTFERRDANSAGTLNASVFLGICETICVPVQALFAVQFAGAPAQVADQFLVQQARANIPEQAPQGQGITRLKMEGDILHMETNMGDKPAQEIFLAAPRGWQFSAPMLEKVERGKAEFTAKVLFKPDQATGKPVIITYSMSNGLAPLAGNAEMTAN